jgi:hypothetical protein
MRVRWSSSTSSSIFYIPDRTNEPLLSHLRPQSRRLVAHLINDLSLASGTHVLIFHFNSCSLRRHAVRGSIDSSLVSKSRLQGLFCAAVPRSQSRIAKVCCARLLKYGRKEAEHWMERVHGDGTLSVLRILLYEGGDVYNARLILHISGLTAVLNEPESDYKVILQAEGLDLCNILSIPLPNLPHPSLRNKKRSIGRELVTLRSVSNKPERIAYAHLHSTCSLNYCLV